MPYAGRALQVLAASIGRGEEPGEPRGQSTDNAVASAGKILEQMETLGASGINFEFMWGQWLNYLPLKHDKVSHIRIN
jgi:hypothetical protein